MATLAQRFEALVDRTALHHRWRGATDQRGIPQIRVDGRLTTARRVAWELRHGPLSVGVRVRACPADPRCVRVDHLTVTNRLTSRAHAARVRRLRGQGSMREIRPGVWKVTVAIEPGRRVYRTIIGDRSDAGRELPRLAAQSGQTPTTLDALVSVHLAHLTDAGRSRATLRRYEQLWRTWLAPSLGTTRPDDLRRADIETSLDTMANAGQSQRSIHQAAVVLNTALGWAAEQGMTRANPVVGCELPNETTITAMRHR